jgi:hypothetical protein
VATGPVPPNQISGANVRFSAKLPSKRTFRFGSVIWLEFDVEDEKATAAKLEVLGIRSFEYFDKAHKYFQAPGGQAFRLAQR